MLHLNKFYSFKIPDPTINIGQREGFSPYDEAKINRMYNCDALPGYPGSAPSGFSGPSGGAAPFAPQRPFPGPSGHSGFGGPFPGRPFPGSIWDPENSTNLL